MAAASTAEEAEAPAAGPLWDLWSPYIAAWHAAAEGGGAGESAPPLGDRASSVGRDSVQPPAPGTPALPPGAPPEDVPQSPASPGRKRRRRQQQRRKENKRVPVFTLPEEGDVFGQREPSRAQRQSVASVQLEPPPSQLSFYWLIAAALAISGAHFRRAAAEARRKHQRAVAARRPHRPQRRVSQRHGAYYVILRQAVTRAWALLRCAVKVCFPLSVRLHHNRDATKKVRDALRVYAHNTRFARAVRRFRWHLTWAQRHCRHCLRWRRSAEVVALHRLNLAEAACDAAATRGALPAPDLAVTPTQLYRLWSPQRAADANSNSPAPPPVMQQLPQRSNPAVFERKGQRCLVSKARQPRDPVGGQLLFSFKFEAVCSMRQAQKDEHHRLLLQWISDCAALRSERLQERRRRALAAKRGRGLIRPAAAPQALHATTGNLPVCAALPPRPLFRVYLGDEAAMAMLADARRRQVECAERLRKAVRLRFLPSLMRSSHPRASSESWWPREVHDWWHRPGAEVASKGIWGCGAGWLWRGSGVRARQGPCGPDSPEAAPPLQGDAEQERMLRVVWAREWTRMRADGQEAELRLASSVPEPYCSVPPCDWVLRCLPPPVERMPPAPAPLRNLFLEELEMTQRFDNNQKDGKKGKRKKQQSPGRAQSPRRAKGR